MEMTMNVTVLRPAFMNKAIANAEKKRIDDEMKQQKEKVTAKVFHTLIELINNTSEKGGTNISFVWTTKHPTSNDVCWADWHLCEDNIIPLLKNAGYRVDTYFYSESWRKQSGKIGTLYIYW